MKEVLIKDVMIPLIVKRGNTVSGVLRLGDLFEVVRERLLACKKG